MTDKNDDRFRGKRFDEVIEILMDEKLVSFIERLELLEEIIYEQFPARRTGKDSSKGN